MTIRPTIPGLPAADEAGPVIPGITVRSSRNCGDTNRWEFEIDRNHDGQAIASLLKAMMPGDELQIATRLSDDVEAYRAFRAVSDGFQMKQSGHGWSGSWQSLNYEWAVYEADRLLNQFRTGGPVVSGSLARRKRAAD